MKKYVFSFKDDQIQIALVSRVGSKIKVKEHQLLFDGLVNRSFDFGLIQNNEELMSATKEFVKKTKNKSTKIDFAIALDNIITRTIELPVLNKKNLKDYIRSNISTYFTVNMDDFFYDYRVLEIGKASKDTKKMMTIMIVVIPSAIIYGIKKFTEGLKLRMGKVGIYPEIMLNFSDSNKNLVVLDIGSTKSVITIFEQGKTFLFTSISHHLGEEDGFDDLMDELEYFTDFFASRHQGTRLDSLIAIGKYADQDTFIEQLKNRLNIPIDELNEKKWKKISPVKQLEAFADIIASQIGTKKIYNKSIDFSNEEKLKKFVDRQFKPIHMLLVLVAVTAAWFFPYWYYLDEQELLYSVNTAVVPQSNEELDIQTSVSELTLEKETLLKKNQTIENINNQKTKYIEVIDQLKKAVPKDVTIKSIVINNKNVTVDFNINYNALDAIELVIAINELNYFKEVYIKELYLDGSEDIFPLVLEMRDKLE